MSPRRPTTCSPATKRASAPPASPGPSCTSPSPKSTCRRTPIPTPPRSTPRRPRTSARMIDAGVLMRDATPCYYAYRLTMGEHVQTGLVAAASVADYDSNRIRKHEFTRPDKEDDRVRQIEALNAQTGPVLLAYPDAPAADALIARRHRRRAGRRRHRRRRHPPHGLGDRRCRRRSPGSPRPSTRMPALYIADGHHRSAAASRVAAARRGQAGSRRRGIFPGGDLPAPPDAHPRLQPRRRATSTAWRRPNSSRRVGERFTVTPAADAGAARPARRLRHVPRRPLVPADDRPGAGSRRRPGAPARRHACCPTTCSAPLLGIADLRRDKRIDFVGGIRGLGELERRVDSGEMAVAFALYPTQMDDLMAVADAGEVMPPKSTWFEPKLADGLVSHVLD